MSFFTIHQSKGLEFPVVVVGSLWDVPRKQYTALDEVLQREYLSRPPFEPLEAMKFFDFWRLYYTAFAGAEPAGAELSGTDWGRAHAVEALCGGARGDAGVADAGAAAGGAAAGHSESGEAEEGVQLHVAPAAV